MVSYGRSAAQVVCVCGCICVLVRVFLCVLVPALRTYHMQCFSLKLAAPGTFYAYTRAHAHATSHPPIHPPTHPRVHKQTLTYTSAHTHMHIDTRTHALTHTYTHTHTKGPNATVIFRSTTSAGISVQRFQQCTAGNAAPAGVCVRVHIWVCVYFCVFMFLCMRACRQ